MMKKNENIPTRKKEKTLSKYEPPKVITYSADELLAEIGPAQACSPFGLVGC